MLKLNQLYNMDCMLGMREFPNKYFDLAIVDPPYGIGDFQQSDGNFKSVEWNDKIPNREYFIELNRISINQIIWGANYYNCFSHKGGTIIWDKLNMHPSMSRCEIASNSLMKKIDYFQYEWHGYIVKREEPTSFHPSQKPVQLYKWLLNKYAKPTDKIIDTHAGSCSSVIAFLDFGCRWIGFEIDKDYYIDAMKRIEIHKAQYKILWNKK